MGCIGCRLLGVWEKRFSAIKLQLVTAVTGNSVGKLEDGAESGRGGVDAFQYRSWAGSFSQID